MGNIFSESNQNRKSIGLLILILFGFELAAVFAFNFIGLLFILPYFDFDIHTVQMILSNPTAYENAKIPLLLVLTTTSIGTFMLVPAWVISKYGGVPLTYFLKLKPPIIGDHWINPRHHFVLCCSQQRYHWVEWVHCIPGIFKRLWSLPTSPRSATGCTNKIHHWIWWPWTFFSWPYRYCHYPSNRRRIFI